MYICMCRFSCISVSCLACVQLCLRLLEGLTVECDSKEVIAERTSAIRGIATFADNLAFRWDGGVGVTKVWPGLEWEGCMRGPDRDGRYVARIVF